MKNIAILASGEGSNALNIINHFGSNDKARVGLVISNKGTAPVVEKALLANVPVMILTQKSEFYRPAFTEFMLKQKFDLIVLAGFLLLLPETLVKAFPKKIVNIHPALLPSHGGKGMYGNRVHEAVLGTKAKESGITIHYVNERFDEGEIIFQARCAVDATDTCETLGQKIHALEHEHYPEVIEKLLS
ncbi:MAG TPA: phosphoribosylglycinamide formyltransferase [Bacteroidia bacterium]|jgi:phosphoribosylglycinamide formyltransferase-1